MTARRSRSRRRRKRSRSTRRSVPSPPQPHSEPRRRLRPLRPPRLLRPPAESENAHPNVPAVEPAPKAVEATSADLEAATNRAFDEGVDTTLEAMSSMLNKLQVPTLQQALSDLGLPTTGRKEELSERLTGALSGA